MVLTQHRSKRKPTGGLYKQSRRKRLFEVGSAPMHTRVDPTKGKIVRTRGGVAKNRLLTADVANVLDQKTKKYSKAKILTVIENTASRHFVRRNIITKGAVIETDKGKAKVTSRPGQDGTVNAVLIS